MVEVGAGGWGRGRKRKAKAKASKAKVPTASILVKWENRDEAGLFTGYTTSDLNELHEEYYGKNIHGGWCMLEQQDADAEEVEKALDALEAMQDASIISDFLHFKKGL